MKSFNTFLSEDMQPHEVETKRVQNAAEDASRSAKERDNHQGHLEAAQAHGLASLHSRGTDAQYHRMMARNHATEAIKHLTYSEDE